VTPPVPVLHVMVPLRVLIDDFYHAHSSCQAVHAHHPERLHTQREAAVDIQAITKRVQ
jgi:hypothetical protein